MRVPARPLLSLRTWFIVTFVVAWNASLLLTVWVSGDTHPAVGPGKWVVLATLGITALLALAITVSERVRELLLEPSRRELYDPAPFMVISFTTGAMAAMLLYFLVL